MTEKLFYQDPYRREFQARVLSCEPVGKQFRVVLDQTAFFPEEGGQYADTGRLGTAVVSDVQETDGVLHHYTDVSLAVGATVTGVLDFTERFDKMQQHTGEHIISGLAHRRFGATNVGFHLGADYGTIDFDRALTKAELAELEQQANEAVYQDLAVAVLYPSAAELAAYDYRSKIEIAGQVRLVEIPGYDLCACCAPHVARTGEVGLIKILTAMNYKGGVRLSFACGRRALRDYQQKQTQAQEISALLSANITELTAAVTSLKTSLAEQKEQYAKRTKEWLELKAQLVAGTSSDNAADSPVTVVIDEDLAGDEIRTLANALLARQVPVAAVFGGNDRDGYRYIINSATSDVRTYSRQLVEVLGGKGGGKPAMVQGFVAAPAAKIKALFS